jgi:hypothetical protein
MMVDGVSLSDLALIFHKDRRSVQQIMRDVPPCGVRGGSPIFSIMEASRYLMTPLVDIEGYIKKLRPNDLPPLLLKEFWSGQLNKQKFSLQAGDLWPTEDVQAVFAAVFKALRQGVLLFADSIEARTELTPKQRDVLHEMSDALLVELHRTLVQGDVEPDEVRVIDDGLGE